MKTVFLFLKNSLFISDLLKTNYIKYLSEKYRVVIFSNTISLESVQAGEYFSSPNVEYVNWRVQNPKLFAIFKFLRMACMHELDRLPSMKIYYNSRPFRRDKRARLLRFLSWPLAPLLTIDFFTKLETIFTCHVSLFQDYVKKYQPVLVITATPGIQVFDAEAIILAKKFKILTLATNFSWDNLTAFKAVRVRKPDYLFVWNKIIQEAALAVHYFSPQRVYITGSTRFDKYFDDSHPIIDRNKFLLSKNLDPNKKTILFATVASGNCPYQLTVLQAILKARQIGELPPVNVLVRLHPFNGGESYRDIQDEPDFYLEKAGREVKIQSGESRIEMDQADFINLKSTLAHTDININYKSTISLESFIFDKPVVNFIDPTAPFQNNYYYQEGSYYYPLVKEGAVTVAVDNNELIKIINTYLANPKIGSASRQKIANSFFASQDGSAYKRNVDFLEKIVAV
ncbi:MAG: CDP-glycerol glycerophosphotransferase family protein [bacterium]|nr:CDP-glycerol glycerophosphotransferase family protein [bacterium]